MATGRGLGQRPSTGRIGRSPPRFAKIFLSVPVALPGASAPARCRKSLCAPSAKAPSRHTRRRHERGSPGRGRNRRSGCPPRPATVRTSPKPTASLFHGLCPLQSRMGLKAEIFHHFSARPNLDLHDPERSEARTNKALNVPEGSETGSRPQAKRAPDRDCLENSAKLKSPGPKPPSAEHEGNYAVQTAHNRHGDDGSVAQLFYLLFSIAPLEYRLIFMYTF